MASIRLYSGDDGESHIEVIDPSSHPDWTELQNAKGIVFRAMPPGFFSDWHVAPRRQYIITLSGEAEIGLGDVNLAEDLTGHGHTTRVVGDVPRIVATVHLDE